MTTSLMSTEGEPSPLRIAISARLVPALSYMVAPLGAALSAFMFTGLMRAMRLSGSAGLGAVTGGLGESTGRYSLPFIWQSSAASPEWFSPSCA